MDNVVEIQGNGNKGSKLALAREPDCLRRRYLQIHLSTDKLCAYQRSIVTLDHPKSQSVGTFCRAPLSYYTEDQAYQEAIIIYFRSSLLNSLRYFSEIVFFEMKVGFLKSV